MVGYKLSNNDWVTPFFVIFRSVREILLVTVFLEHPVMFTIGTLRGSLRKYYNQIKMLTRTIFFKIDFSTINCIKSLSSD